MLLTESNFYFFDEYFKATRQFPTNQVQTIHCSNENPTLCCIMLP